MEAVLNSHPPALPAYERQHHPVDLVHLSRYTLGESELEREVLELFCTQSGVYLERLREADTDQHWREAAHSLKGSALAIGAWRAAEAASAAERLSGEALKDGRHDRLSALETAVSEAETYIRSLF